MYYPYLNTPLDRSLDILDGTGSSIWSADLREDGNAGDEDAAKYRDYIPPWHGLSAHGEGQGHVSHSSHEVRHILIPLNLACLCQLWRVRGL